MLRKFLVVLMVLLVSIGIYAKPLEVWMTGLSNEELKIFKEMSEDYTAKYGVEVEITNLSWADFENRFILAAASGDVPDIGTMGPLFAPELGLRGAVIDLKATFPDFDEVAKRVPQGFFHTLTYKGSVFAIPYNANVTMGYQRDDILAELGAGPMNSWDDLKAILPKAQARNSNMALEWGVGEGIYADLNMFMWQRGADDYTPDLKKSGYDSPESIAAFTEYVELYTKHNILKEVPFFQAFTSGELFYMLQQQNMYANLNLAAPQIEGKWSMVQVPGTYQGDKLVRITTAGGAAMTIFKASPMKQEAWNFFKWITEPEVQRQFATRVRQQIQGAMFVPANVEATDGLNIPEKELLLLDKSINDGRTATYGLVAPRLRRRYLQFAGQEAILYGVDPKVAISKAAAEHNSEIAKKEVEYSRFINKLLQEQKKN